MIDIILIIIAVYVSIFTWITKRDIKSNNKSDFYVPAYFLISISAIGVMLVANGLGDGAVLTSDERTIFIVFILIFAFPVILRLLMTGHQQDRQKERGDLTYNVGDKFWIAQNKDVTLTSEQAVFVGKGGLIEQIHYEDGVKSASMAFDEGGNTRFQLASLSKDPPVVEEKGWWNS